jgi:hypothetical protein
VKRRNLGLIIGLILVLAASMPVGTAAAKKKRIKATVSIAHRLGPAGHSFSGDVSSRKRKCERGRVVSLYSASGGPPVGEPARTDPEGHYLITIPGDQLLGDFYVAVERKKKRRFVCKRAESERIPAPSGP